eukprot:3791196-Rhodomonas_salina.2
MYVYTLCHYRTRHRQSVAVHAVCYHFLCANRHPTSYYQTAHSKGTGPSVCHICHYRTAHRTPQVTTGQRIEKP